MLGRFGATELILVLVIVLVIFGPSKLPEIGKAIGRTLQEFRKATTDRTKNSDDDEPGEPGDGKL